MTKQQLIHLLQINSLQTTGNIDDDIINRRKISVECKKCSHTFSIEPSKICNVNTELQKNKTTLCLECLKDPNKIQTNLRNIQGRLKKFNYKITPANIKLVVDDQSDVIFENTITSATITVKWYEIKTRGLPAIISLLESRIVSSNASSSDPPLLPSHIPTASVVCSPVVLNFSLEQYQQVVQNNSIVVRKEYYQNLIQSLGNCKVLELEGWEDILIYKSPNESIDVFTLGTFLDMDYRFLEDDLNILFKSSKINIYEEQLLLKQLQEYIDAPDI